MNKAFWSEWALYMLLIYAVVMLLGWLGAREPIACAAGGVAIGLALEARNGGPWKR